LSSTSELWPSNFHKDIYTKKKAPRITGGPSLTLFC
jgi:hypothetical protein